MLRNDGYAISILEYEKKGKSTVPNLKDFYPNIKSSLCEFDKEKFPYKNETFDFVILFGVIEHIEPPTFHFWLEMNRVLKVGGHLFIDNPNPHNLRKRIFSAFGLDSNLLENLAYYKQKDYFTGHFREHSKKELIYCIKDNMKLIDSGYLPFAKFSYYANSPLRKKIILFFYNSVCRIFRSTLDTVYVIGQKKSI